MDLETALQHSAENHSPFALLYMKMLSERTRRTDV